MLNSGCARRGASGALFPKSALCGAEFPLEDSRTGNQNHFGRPPRNRRSRTSSGPEGSSDKWCRLCRGLIPVIAMIADFLKGFNRGCTTIFFECGIWNAECGFKNLLVTKILIISSAWKLFNNLCDSHRILEQPFYQIICLSLHRFPLNFRCCMFDVRCSFFNPIWAKTT